MHKLTNNYTQPLSQVRKTDKRGNVTVLKIILHIFVYISLYIHIKSTKKKQCMS